VTDFKLENEIKSKINESKEKTSIDKAPKLSKLKLTRGCSILYNIPIIASRL